MLHVLEHALIDSLKVFILVFILFFALSFIEKGVSKKLNSNKKISPFFGSLFGLIPQCGISVAASDLYMKKKITIGTLIAVFISCSDEAIFILLSNGKILTVCSLLITKLIIGYIFGSLLDAFYQKKQKTKNIDNDDVEVCHHNHHHTHSKHKFMDIVLHNLFHALEVFIYVLIVNVLFGTLFHYVGTDNIRFFIEKNRYLSPLFASLIGIIPNCASSIILTEIYIENLISFGSLLAGLIVNAGLGLIYLFKNKDNLKNNLIILGLLFIIANFVGYIVCLIIGFR